MTTQGGSKQQKLFSPRSGGQKSKIKVSEGLVPSGGSEGESVPSLSPCFWWSSAIFSVPWLVDTSLQSLSPQGVVCMCLCLLFLQGLQSYWIRALIHPNQVYLHLGSSLAVQWLGLGAFTAVVWVQSLVRELRSCKLRGTAKKKKVCLHLNLIISAMTQFPNKVTFTGARG